MPLHHRQLFVRQRLVAAIDAKPVAAAIALTVWHDVYADGCDRPKGVEQRINTRMVRRCAWPCDQARGIAVI